MNSLSLKRAKTTVARIVNLSGAQQMPAPRPWMGSLAPLCHKSAMQLVPTLDTMFLAALAWPRQNPLLVYRTFSGHHQQPLFRRRQHMCTACLFLERSGEWRPHTNFARDPTRSSR